MAVSTEDHATSSKSTIVLDGATIRLAGDSGDGMQVVGGQFTNTSALHGNDVATFPDFPAEIRAHAARWPASAAFRCNSHRQTSLRLGTR